MTKLMSILNQIGLVCSVLGAICVVVSGLLNESCEKHAVAKVKLTS